jgi:hypothetical protein
MTFREAGIRFLYGDTLNTLSSDATAAGTEYHASIDDKDVTVDELNEVWHLPADVVDQFSQTDTPERYAVITLPATEETPAKRDTSPDPFVVGCRDQKDTRSLKSRLGKPLNAVLKEDLRLQKFPLRAGISQRNTACPHTIIPTHYASALTGIVTSPQQIQTRLENNPWQDTSGRYTCRHRRASIDGEYTASSYRHATQSTNRQSLPSRWPSISGSLISVNVDGVSHYDTAT